MRHLLMMAVVAGLMTGCGRGDFALKVQVNAPASSASRCVKVTASRGADSLVSDPATLTDSSVEVLIALDSTAEVTVQAAGYDNTDCAGTPVEQSEQRNAAPTKTPPFPVVQLTLAPVTTTTDGGTDAGVDAGIDAGADDGGFDGGLDDAGFDGGIDDAGFDAGLDDAGFDAGPDDAGFDAGTPDAGPECTLATVGQSCGGGTGTCNFQNVCLANFPYPVSNFSIADLPAPDGGNVWVVTGNINFNADTGDAMGQPDPPSVFLASDAGYTKVLLIQLEGLIVQDGGSLTFNNATPVIIAVNGDATINGSINANSGTGLAALCGASLGAAGGANTNGSGAGGGGFGTLGGHGGEGWPGGGSGGDGGLPSGTAQLQPLRGGCAGGTGGGGGGSGGAGGGALQLSVRNTLILNGRVWAPGKGGTEGATTGKGGGGGGSGGAVLLEANTLLVGSLARLTVNGGGGGGGGAAGGSKQNGQPGEDGHALDGAPASGGAGGTGQYPGGAGGNGAALGFEAADGGDGQAGGGGGGGGGGRILLKTSNACINDGAVISPAPAISAALITDAGC